MSTQSTIPMMFACSAVLFAGGCSDGNSVPNQTTTTLTLVSPAGGAADVAPTAAITMTFSGPMAQGMENYMDVHAGTAADAIMPMTCTWSADRTMLTCTHATPFADGSTYTIHVGAGMTDANGNVVSMANMMGGTWLMSGMMGGMHAGQPMNTMGAGWKGSNGSYGMIFTFTTT